MYLAFVKNKGQSQYFLRQSCTIDHQLTFKNLFNLGSDPSIFIKYAGGNAFYFDETLEDAISKTGIEVDSDELEDLLWPWIRPDIRRAVDTFRNRFQKKYKKLTDTEKTQIRECVPSFDKRRAHYLKFGNMDQGPVENMPVTLFKNLIHQSRDEIEHRFIKQEFVLKEHELKTYVFTVFNLHSFFSSFLAKRMPHALDQEKVDTYFIKEVCRLNSALFNSDTHLDDHMIRYLIMFFDHAYADTTLLDDFANAYMNRNRSFKPRPQKSITTQNACNIFCITKKELPTLTKKRLTKLYRGLARKVHPDTGGSHENFVKLNNAYQTLLEKVR